MSPDKITPKRTRQDVRQERLRAMREYLTLLAEEERDAADAPDLEAPVQASGNSMDDRTAAYVKWPLADAIPVYLSTCKLPQTTKQIAQALLRAGREFESNRPVHSVRTTLKKLMTKNDDIFHVGWAKWHLRSKYTKAKLEKLLSEGPATAGTGGKSKKEHGRRTANGIKKRREQNAHWGPRLKATPEVLEQAKELMRNGVTLTEVSRRLKIAIPTLYNYGIRQRALKQEGQLKKELPLGDQTQSENVVRFAKN
jgi:hypothetical protein